MGDTLHFVAENFEAVATRVESYRVDFGPHFDHWVVSVPSCSPHTIRVEGRAGQGLNTSVWNASKGWLGLREAVDGEAVWDTQLALAISLVYSVPGVRALSERRGKLPPDRIELIATIDGYEFRRFIDDVPDDCVIIRGDMTGVVRELDTMRGVPLFVDAGGLGKAFTDDLRRVYGIQCEPLPKGTDP